MTFSPRTLAIAFLLAAMVFPGTQAFAVSDPAEMLPNAAQEARAEAIGRQLRCLVCQNEDIEDSGASLARDLRRAVRVQVAEGRSDRQIMAWMTARYGSFVRLSPPVSPATLVLWAMPVLALAAGLVAASFAFRRRAPASGGNAEGLDDAERARLRELTRDA